MANTFELIQATTVGAGGTSSIDFNSIQPNWTDLVLKLSLRGNRAATTEGILLSFNGSGSNFTTKLFGGAGSGSGFSAPYTRGYTGDVDAANSTSSTFGSAEIYIPNYTSSNYKSFSTDVVSEQNGTTAYAELFAGLWSNTSAITSISIACDTSSQTWSQYSTAYLYGVKNA